MRPLCRDLGKPTSAWDTFCKMVQKAMQRKRRKSRGDRSPIELTTSLVPTTGVDLIIDEGVDLRVVDEDALQALDTAVDAMADLLETHWDLADTVRRPTSQANRAAARPTWRPYHSSHAGIASCMQCTSLTPSWTTYGEGRLRSFTK